MRQLENGIIDADTTGLDRETVTELLLHWGQGHREALERLMPLVYDEMHRQARRMMAGERHDHTLQPTALVHETFLHLVDQDRIVWQNRAQFFGVASQLMRRVVLKHARQHNAEKRGGQNVRIPLDEDLAIAEQKTADLLDLDAALQRLEELDSRQAKIVELRYFGGLSVEETANCMDLSTATIKREMRMARAWLKHELEDPESPQA